MTSKEKKQAFVKQLYALTDDQMEIAKALMLADQAGEFADDEAIPNKKGLRDVVSEKLRESVKESMDYIQRGYELAEQGKQTKAEAVAQALAASAGALPGIYLGAAIKTIGEYLKGDNAGDKQKASRIAGTIGMMLENVPERTMRNVGSMLSAGLGAAGIVGAAKGISKSQRAINSATGKLVLGQTAGIATRNIKGSQFIEAIQAASNKTELNKIAKLYVENNGNLSNIADDLANRMKQLAEQEAEAAQENIRKSLGISGRVRTAEEAGSDIERSMSSAKKSIGEAYKSKEEALQAYEGFGKSEGAARPNILGTPINERLMKMLDDLGEEIGYKIGGEPSYLAGKGTMPLSLKQQAALNEVKKILAPVGNFEEMIRARRQIKEMINNWGRGAESFYAGASKDREWLTKKVYSEVNNIYKSEAEKLIGGEAGKAFRKELDLLDEQYSQAMKAINTIESGMSLSSRTRVDAIRQRIATMSATDMAKVMATAEKIDALKPVVNELKQGFFEGILYNALDDAGKLNVAKFARAWKELSKEKGDLIALMLDKEQIRNIEKAIAAYESGTAALKYLKPGMSEKALNAALENITTQTRVYEARELQFIDNLLGLTGDDSFYSKAVKFARGKELGMSARGKIATTPTLQTGKSLMAQAGGAVSGGAVGYVVGSLLGTGPGIASGLLAASAGQYIGQFIQSPAGVLWLYKTLSSLPSIRTMMVRGAIGGLIGASTGAQAGDDNNALRNAIYGFAGGAAVANVLPGGVIKVKSLLKGK